MRIQRLRPALTRCEQPDLEGIVAFLLLRPQNHGGGNPEVVEDSVAQLVEHDTFNVGVLGSSPSGVTEALA